MVRVLGNVSDGETIAAGAVGGERGCNWGKTGAVFQDGIAAVEIFFEGKVGEGISRVLIGAGENLVDVSRVLPVGEKLGGVGLVF